MRAFLVLLLAVACLATPFNPAHARSLVKRVQRFVANQKSGVPSLSFPHKIQSDEFGSNCNLNAFGLALMGSSAADVLMSDECEMILSETGSDMMWSEFCSSPCIKAMKTVINLAQKYDCNFFDIPECTSNADCGGDVCNKQHCVTDCTTDPNLCWFGEECVASDKNAAVKVCVDPDEIELDASAAWAATVYMLNDLMCSRNSAGDYCMEIANATNIGGGAGGLDCEALYDMGCCLPTFLNFSIYCAGSFAGPDIDFGELISWSNMTAECPLLDYTTPCPGVASAEKCCAEGVFCSGAAVLSAPLALLVCLLTFLLH